MAHTPKTSSSESQIGFIQGPSESDREFAQRISFCLENRDPKADDHLLGWIPLFYTNKGLSFFEGGATFIDETDGIRRPIIHLKKVFQKKSHWLFYSKEEILQHELVHAMRCMFDEPKIEEFIAYQTSKVSYRRYLGPLFTSPKEIALFLGLLVLPVFFANPWFFGFPLISLGIFMFRLGIRQRKFSRLLSLYPTKEERLILQDHHFSLKSN